MLLSVIWVKPDLERKCGISHKEKHRKKIHLIFIADSWVFKGRKTNWNKIVTCKTLQEMFLEHLDTYRDTDRDTLTYAEINTLLVFDMNMSMLWCFMVNIVVSAF